VTFDHDYIPKQKFTDRWREFRCIWDLQEIRTPPAVAMIERPDSTPTKALTEQAHTMLLFPFSLRKGGLGENRNQRRRYSTKTTYRHVEWPDQIQNVRGFSARTCPPTKPPIHSDSAHQSAFWFLGFSLPCDFRSLRVARRQLLCGGPNTGISMNRAEGAELMLKS
jgi:hypothetical protein